VITSFKAHRKPEYLLKRYILQAIELDSPLPNNNEADAELNEMVEKCSKPGEPAGKSHSLEII